MSRDLKWLIFCGALAAGEALGFCIGLFGSCWPFFASLTIFAILIGFGFRVRGWHFFAIFCLGITLALACEHQKKSVLDSIFASSSNKPYVAECFITRPPNMHHNAKGAFRVSVPAQLGPLAIRVLYAANEGATIPRVGERWRFTGWLSRKPLPGRDIRVFWVKKASASPVRLPDTFFGRLTGLVSSWREDLSRRAGIGLEHDPQAAALNRAILLGERAAIDPFMREDFAAAGTIHLFAISGLHVMFIAYLLRLMLSGLGIPFRGVGAVLIPLLWLYAWVTGFPPSAIRATLMATFYYAAPIFWRQSNGIVAWSLTFLLVHILAPFRLHDVGCRLSFVVMLAIVTWLRWGYHFRRPFVQGFAISQVAWAAGVPITARIFERFTVGGILANPLLIPLASVCVTAGVLGCFASFISPFLASHFNNFAALCTRVMAISSNLIAQIPGVSSEVAPWSGFMCAAWYLACLLLLFFANHVYRRQRYEGWLNAC